MTELLKFLCRLLIHIIKSTLQILQKLLNSTLIYVVNICKWFVRPKVYRSIIGLISVIVPFCWGIYSYYFPKIDITFTPPLNSYDIFTSIFTLENNGNSTVYNVKTDFTINEFYGVHPNQGKYLLDMINIDATPVYRILRENKKQYLPFDLKENNVLQFTNDSIATFKADLHIYVEYDYWYKTMSIRDTFKFKASDFVNNSVIWRYYQ